MSSAGAELHSLVSAAADGIYIAGCLSVLTGLLVKHYILVDNMAAKTLANKTGVGRIRDLSGKLLWIQEKTAKGNITVTQVSTDLNIADLATKPLTASRMGTLLFLCGIVDAEPIGENDFEEMQAKKMSAQKVKRLAKVIMRLMVLGEITGAEGSLLPGGAQSFCSAEEDPGFMEEPYATSWGSWPQSGLAFAFVSKIYVDMWIECKPQIVRPFRTVSEGITKTHDLASQIRLGLVRLGGYVGETGEPLDEEELRP